MRRKKRRKKRIGKSDASQPTLAMQPVYSSFIPASSRRFEPGFCCRQPTSCDLYGLVHQGQRAASPSIPGCFLACLPLTCLGRLAISRLSTLSQSCLPCPPPSHPSSPQPIPAHPRPDEARRGRTLSLQHGPCRRQSRLTDWIPNQALTHHTPSLTLRHHSHQSLST